MRTYGFHHAFFMPFFSRAFYRDVGLHWKGVGYLFLLVLLLVCWLPTAIRTHVMLGRFVNQELPPVVAKIPDIEIKKGVLTADCEQPYEISVEEDGKQAPFAVIDTTGEYTSLEGTEYLMLVTASKVFVNDGRKTEIHDLSQMQSFKLNRDVINLWAGRLRTWTAPGLYLVGVVGSLIYRIGASLVFAAIGLLIAGSFRVRLTYESLIRLSVMAMAPVIIAGMIHDLCGSPIPGILWWLIGIGVTLGYLAFGIRNCTPDPLAGAPPIPVPGASNPPPPA